MKWQLVKKKLSDLKPSDKNPRRITEKGLKDLSNSITKFGIAEPIVINKGSNEIIGGHARYLALKEKGITEVDCYAPDKALTDKQVEELNIRLNKNIAGEFDFDLLANNFAMEDLLNWGFEKYELGLSDIDIDKFFDEKENPDKEHEAKKITCPKCGEVFEL